MTILPLLLLSFLGLSALIYVAVISLRSHGIKSYSISFGIGHFLFIIVMSCIYYFGSRDAQHQLFWILPGTVDLPISLLIQILALHSMIIFVMLLATLGSLQYAAIG